MASSKSRPTSTMPALSEPAFSKPALVKSGRPRKRLQDSEKLVDNKPRINPDYTCFGLRLAPSKIHRWGVYATEFIPRRRKVMEYTGEHISRRETKRRAQESKFIYLFTLDAYWTIDGSVGGSGAQYINHCCEPNLAARIVKGHIVYVSLRDIQPGEELTIDYHFDKKVERVVCRCGASKCRGTINLLE